MDNSLFDIADVHNIAGDDESLGSKAVDWVTKGVPVALASGVVSILNTGISLGNMFGDFEQINTEDKIREYDNNLADYYSQHKEGADVGGFVLTSLAPGTLGIKGLKALQSIKGGGAIGEATSSITGYAASVEREAIKKAAETVVGPENLIFGTINSNKLKAIAAGVGDQALQGLAFETGVLLTMNQNPVINPDDRSYFGSIWHNIPQSALNAAVFGAVGGAFNAASVTGKIKSLVQNEDRQNFGAVGAEIMGDNSLLPGTRASYMYNQIQELRVQQQALLQEATIDEKFLMNFDKKIARMETGLDKFITDKVAGKDGELAEQIRIAIGDLKSTMENGYNISQSEKFARTLGDARSAQRLGGILTEEEVTAFLNPTKTFTHEELHTRLETIAGNLNVAITRGPPGSSYHYAKDAAGNPSILIPTKGGAMEYGLTDIEIFAHELGHALAYNVPLVFAHTTPYTEVMKTLPDWYNLKKLSETFRPHFHSGGEGAANRLHAQKPNEILADAFAQILLGRSPHEALGHMWTNKLATLEKMGMTEADVVEFITQLIRAYGNDLKHTQRLVKLAGFSRGAVSEVVFPVAGDLGKFSTKKGEIYIDGEYQKLGLVYKPTDESPTYSSMQFLKQMYTEPLRAGEQIPYDNLPLLEKALRENTPEVKVLGAPETIAAPSLAEIVLQSKLDHMTALVNQGKSEDFISRALNVPKEWLADPQNNPISLFAKEDHTKPLYAKVNYSSQDEINKFAAEGMTRVYEKAKIAHEQNKKAAAYALGEDISLFADSGPLVNVTTHSDVANFGMSHNAPYGSFGSKAQQDGKMEQQIVNKWAAARSDVLHSPQEAIVLDSAKRWEMNVVVAKLRSGDSDWIKLTEDLYPGAADEFILIQRKTMQEALASKDAIEALNLITNVAAKDNAKIIRLSQDSPVVEYLENFKTITGEYADKQNALNAAKGSDRRIPTDAYYAPPIDTTLQPYFVMVRMKQPLAAENPFTYVVAPNAEALEKKIAAIRQQYGDTLDIFSSTNIKDKKTIEGTFESGDFFTKTRVDESLGSKGLLTDFIPRTDDHVFKEFDNWMWRQEHALVRQSIEAIRADEFAQLRFLADGYGELYKSKFGGKELNPADNPYLQLINTSLNVSNKGHYDQYWGSINRGVGKAWNAASEIYTKMWGASEKGEISVIEANRIAIEHGWRAPYGDVLRDVLTNKPPLAAGDSYVTVYRGEYAGPKKKIPDWITEKMKESGQFDAQGRWWTEDKTIADWYAKEAGEHGKIISQEVPKSVVESSRVTKASKEVQGYSRDPDNELYLPKEYASQNMVDSTTYDKTVKQFSEVWNPLISDPNALNKFVGKANLAISTLMLRMDALNAVVNTISLPILMQAELTSIKKNLSDPTIVGKLSNLLSEQVPGTAHRIPSAASLLYDGAAAYVHNPEVGIPGINQRMYEYFSSIGAIKTDPQLLRSAMDAVPMTQDAIKSEKGIVAYTANLAKRVGELGAKYTGNNLAEDFVRFQAAHAMLRVAKEAGITESAELASYINTYVNRVHGNYLSSQRPSLFQGPIGQAIGLFQTYQFNMIQQMTRYLQQGDRSAVVAAAALQNTIFGMQGNPMFYQLNSYIGNSNRENRDIVSTVGATVGSPELGKADPARWLMYGLGANALQVNLYSRGDLTPRYATIVPDRIQDIPAISIPTKAIGSFLDSMNMISKGAGVAPSILHGLAHSGFNRPMAGLAALAEGGRTTSQGTLLNAYNDIDGWLIAATLAGGKQLNEAVLVDQYYRMQSYHSADSKRIQEVSEAVKLTIAGQKGILNPDQTQAFLDKYVQAGGSLARSNQWLIEQTKNSTQSVVNRMKNNYNSPFGKRMRDMMEGGQGLENLNLTQPE